MTGGRKRRRRLIVNADDFGQSEGVTGGILAAHEHGIVTSTSLMVRWPAAADAVSRARAFGSLSVGLHIDLGEWRRCDDQWDVVYQVVDSDDADAVRREVVGQFERFEALCGRPPSHVDSHQHVHTRGPALPVAREMARRFGIVLRQYSDIVTYSGAFYGQTSEGQPLSDLIRVPALIKTLEDLPDGTTELSCHPAMRADLVTTYSAERIVELATLCDPEVRAAVERCGIQLISFDDVGSSA